MTDKSAGPERRTILKGAAAMAGIVTAANTVAAQPAPAARLADVPLMAQNKITVERRGQLVLIGINRPQIQNRMDPEASHFLAKALTDYDRDDSLRCAVLFGHGDNFSRGVDVDAHAASIGAAPTFDNTGLLNTLGTNASNRLSKPLIVVVHGDTWNLGHEIFLAADIRVCAADTRFGQDETSHARFPGGGGTIRFVREVGWGNAMRYVLTGDHWNAEEARRMGEVQEIAPNKDAALQLGIALATKVAACGPLGIKTALSSGHVATDVAEAEAFSKLGKQYNDLYATRDFKEGRDAEAQNRPPVYIGR